LTFALLTMYN